MSVSTGNRLNDVRVDDLESTIAAAKKDPQVAATSWTSHTRWLGGTKSEASCRQHTLHFDEPTAVGGDDTQVSPHETVLAAYGACLTVGIAVNCARRGITLRNLEVELKGFLDIPGFLALDSAPGLDQEPGYKRVQAHVTVQADAPEPAVREIVETVFRVTPVGGTLRRKVEVENQLTVQV
ncbi:MAG: OsmC family protein [Thermaerobacter sp.]|jgi:uncharacterized OsmC-like protein|nr:OsmC family protein [Thermaerobacter sp.]